MKLVTPIVRGATTVEEEGAALLLYGMMATIVLNVTLRFLGMPLAALYEIMSALIAAIIGLSIAGSQRNKAHLAIDLLTKMLPQRAQSIIAMFLTIISVAFWVMVVFGLIRYTSLQITSGSASDILGLPTWPQLVVMIIGLIVLILVFLVDLTRQTRSAVTGKEVEAVW